ncbi:MAG TPA: ABC transporter substrate-binding protein [Cyanobacteria bacterium UBA11371]|nr:ABC transporter substrate-binding protein [Cyanobacteria bacterium UBA11371]HBE30483.1 ABC transporter substrate-binding protein [Cyanobacteria bacterium UBA11368]
MTQKIGFKWVLLLLVIITLTSCSARVEQGITVTLSGWQSNPNEQQLLRRVIKKFETQHPNIKVKHEVINDQYMDVIKTRLIGDAAPDVFYLDAFEAPLLMKNEVLEPLDNYITKSFDLGDFIPAMLKAFRLNGKTYGLPKDFSTLALFYNTKLLDEPPKTWNDLLDYSRKLTVDRNSDRRPEQYGFGIAPELSRLYFITKAFGGQLIDKKGYATFASPRSLKGLELIINQYRQERTAAQPSDVGASNGSEMFGRGQAAMVIEGSWAIPYLKETFPKTEFATAEVPKINGKKGTMAYTVAYVMNKKAKHKQAAWELISYLTGKEGMKAWAREGLVLPSRKSVLADLGYANNPLYAPFVTGAAYATIWQAGENLPTILTHFNNQFISALIGEQSLKDAMLKAQTTANKEIQAAN